MKSRTFKRVLTVVGLGLWLGSLVAPVLDEGGTTRSGFYVLTITLTFGVIYLWAIPWALLNVGFLALAVGNLGLRDWRTFAGVFLTFLGAVTVLNIGLDDLGRDSGLSPNGVWRYGISLWTGALVLVGVVGVLPNNARSVGRTRAPRTPPN